MGVGAQSYTFTNEGVPMYETTEYCGWCRKVVTIEWWQSDVDPGDNGWIRSCGHVDSPRPPTV